MTARRTIRLTLQYDGTGLYGFQRQRDPDRPTVQGLLERAAEELLGHPVSVVGAGRTDAGVHAVGQVAHFHTHNPLPASRMAAALNHRLPPSVRVVWACEAPPGFHARRDATSRIYCYHILHRATPSALAGRFSLWWPGELDLDVMAELARHFVGRRPFDAFGSPTRPGSGTVRTLYGCRVDQQAVAGGRLVRVCFEADAFLYRMVRRMVGALLAAASGRIPPEAVLAALEAGGAGPARGRGGPSGRPLAPAVAPHGLVLVHVHYGPPPAGVEGCGSILDTLLGLWLEWPRGRNGPCI